MPFDPEKTPGAWPGGFSVGTDQQQHALGVQGTQLRRYIRSFDDARKVDLADERLPLFDYTAANAKPLVPAPSMRIPALGVGGPEGPVSMEEAIKRMLDEQNDEGSTVEMLAERLAMGRQAAGRPKGFKRFETT